MGSGSNKRETMAKIARERAVKARRDRQQQGRRRPRATRPTPQGTLAKTTRIEGSGQSRRRK